MTDKTGDQVFSDNVDEILAEKIIRHTGHNTNQGFEETTEKPRYSFSKKGNRNFIHSRSFLPIVYSAFAVILIGLILKILLKRDR